MSVGEKERVKRRSVVKDRMRYSEREQEGRVENPNSNSYAISSGLLLTASPSRGSCVCLCVCVGIGIEGSKRFCSSFHCCTPAFDDRTLECVLPVGSGEA
jgi:hypothetical protein